jgi:hypothetical protein
MEEMVNKEDLKVGDRVEYRSFGKGKIICLFEKVARVVFDKELSLDSICSEYYDIETNGLCVPFDFLSHITEPSEQTDLVRLNSRFTTNQEVVMDNEIAKHGVELQTIIITTQLVDLSLSVNATMKNYNIKNLYDLTDKIATAYIALEELKKMWQIDDETIDELTDKKMGEIKKKMEE